MVDMDGQVQGDLVFVMAELEEFQEPLIINARFGEIKCKNVYAGLVASLNKTDLIITDNIGESKIESNYGIIEAQQAIMNLFAISGQKTKIIINPVEPETFDYDLATTYSEISLPSSLGRASDIEDVQSFSSSSGNSKKITISTTYQPILINE